MSVSTAILAARWEDAADCDCHRASCPDDDRGLDSRGAGSRLAFRLSARGVQIAVGFLIVSSTLFVLAVLDRADRTHLGALAAVLAVVALVWLGLRAWPLRKRLSLRAVRTRALGLGVRAWLGAAAAGAYGTWVLFCAMLPPTAVDELNHSLPTTRRR
jgi:cation transport ATPase